MEVQSVSDSPNCSTYESPDTPEQSWNGKSAQNLNQRTGFSQKQADLLTDIQNIVEASNRALQSEAAQEAREFVLQHTNGVNRQLFPNQNPFGEVRLDPNELLENSTVNP
jgi:hypothetical protein